MHHIRPYKAFTLLRRDHPDRVVRIPMPSRRGVGSISALETFLIIAAAWIVGAKRIFEFGTFLGSTTLNLALNVPGDGEVFTIDMDQHLAADAEQLPVDAELTRTHLASADKLDFSGSPVSSKITVLHGDSTKFHFSPWADSIDLVFVDGGHDLPTVRADTESAMRIARKVKPSCVICHDYRNPEYPDLTAFLEERSQQLDVLHVEDTMLCVWFSRPSPAMRELLLGSN